MLALVDRILEANGFGELHNLSTVVNKGTCNVGVIGDVRKEELSRFFKF